MLGPASSHPATPTASSLFSCSWTKIWTPFVELSYKITLVTTTRRADAIILYQQVLGSAHIFILPHIRTDLLKLVLPAQQNTKRGSGLTGYTIKLYTTPQQIGNPHPHPHIRTFIVGSFTNHIVTPNLAICFTMGSMLRCLIYGSFLVSPIRVVTSPCSPGTRARS